MATWWDSDDYKAAFVLMLPGGAQCSCATKKNTEPAEIYFKYSADGATIPADGDAVLAAEITAEPATCALAVATDGRIHLTNSYGVHRYSDAKGATGTWADVS